MKSLKLFNAVISEKSNNVKPFISKEGFIIHSDALYAKDAIISYFLEESLSGNDLNKTFHKSWKKIEQSSRYELIWHQVLHYLSLIQRFLFQNLFLLLWLLDKFHKVLF